MQTLERHLNELPIVDYVGLQNYDDLLHDAHILAKENHVDEMLQSSTFELLEEMRVYDEDIAIGGLRTLPVALSTASEIGLFYDIDIDRGSIFASSLLHDVGKMALPKELLVKSTIGQEWTTADTLTMRQHIYTGGMILRNRCLPVIQIEFISNSLNICFPTHTAMGLLCSMQALGYAARPVSLPLRIHKARKILHISCSLVYAANRK